MLNSGCKPVANFTFQKCRAENRAWTEEKLAVQRRKKALEERNNRIKNVDMSTQDDDDGALDRLISTLRDGGSVKTRRRQRPPDVDTSLTTDPNETYNAKDMLEQLKAGGFITTPLSPTTAPTSQLPRLRRRTARGLNSELLEISYPIEDSLQDSDDSVPETTDTVETEDISDLEY